jgi:hypothetical protein
VSLCAVSPAWFPRSGQADWDCYIRTKNYENGVQISEEDLLDSLYECIQSTAQRTVVNQLHNRFCVKFVGA